MYALGPITTSLSITGAVDDRARPMAASNRTTESRTSAPSSTKHAGRQHGALDGPWMRQPCEISDCDHVRARADQAPAGGPVFVWMGQPRSYRSSAGSAASSSMFAVVDWIVPTSRQ